MGIFALNFDTIKMYKNEVEFLIYFLNENEIKANWKKDISSTKIY